MDWKKRRLRIQVGRKRLGLLSYWKEGNGSIGRPATFPGVVDWDGPNPKKEGEPPRDWSGWGKFPGAEYLGIQDEKEEEPEQEADHAGMKHETQPQDKEESSATDPEPAPGADHTGMKHEMEEPPAQLNPSNQLTDD